MRGDYLKLPKYVLELNLPDYLSDEIKLKIGKAVRYGQPILIDGLIGRPTGKTRLCEHLREFGVTDVYEKHEMIEIVLDEIIN